jgi:hypothetical protein
MKYRSSLDVGQVIESANDALKPLNPECYVIFLLAVAAGPLRKEIDLLEWASFRWEENVIRIQPTKFFHPKSEDSIGDIQVDTEVKTILREYHAMVKGPFAIPSRLSPKPSSEETATDTRLTNHHAQQSCTTEPMTNLLLMRLRRFQFEES